MDPNLPSQIERLFALDDLIRTRTCGVTRSQIDDALPYYAGGKESAEHARFRKDMAIILDLRPVVRATLGGRPLQRTQHTGCIYIGTEHVARMPEDYEVPEETEADPDAPHVHAWGWRGKGTATVCGLSSGTGIAVAPAYAPAYVVTCPACKPSQLARNKATDARKREKTEARAKARAEEAARASRWE